jgi:hypothetical protein
MVAHLSFRQQQDDRLAGAIADSVELGVQATFRAPIRRGTSPFEQARRGPVRLQVRAIEHDAF